MLNSFLLAVRFLILVFGGHKQVALENIALRHQLAVFTREKKRPRLRNRDRLFWIALKKLWKDWRTALIFVQPETVIGWQRERFKRYWWKLSQPKQPGRPRISSEIRKLIQAMATANPTWGAPRVDGELKKLGFEISERTVCRVMSKKWEAVADMDDVFSKSRGSNGFDRLLHSSDHTTPSPVHFRHPCA